MAGLSCVLTEILIRVQVSDCGVDNGSFWKHYFNYFEDSLMMAPMRCRNMWEDMLCICCVYIYMYTSACEVGFLNWLKTKYLVCQHKPARKQQMKSVGRRHRPSRLIGRQSCRLVFGRFLVRISAKLQSTWGLMYICSDSSRGNSERYRECPFSKW